VKLVTRKEGVNVVLDMVAGDYVARNIKCLADDGRHVTIAVQGGAKAEVPMWQIMARRLTLTGSTLRARTDEFKACWPTRSSRTCGRWWKRAKCAR
jgi:NADPH:quinone reductase-like Zn-dependent oxidoreductase